MLSPSNIDIEILAELEAAEQDDAAAKDRLDSAFMHRLRAGWRLLEKKETIPHDGHWREYLRGLAEQLAGKGYPPSGRPYSLRWFQEWMFLAKHLPTEQKAQPVAHLGMKENLRRIRIENKPKIAPLVDNLEPNRLRHHGVFAGEPFYKILQGDVRQLITNLSEVHMVITSPPYYDKITYGGSDREIGHEQSVETYIAGLVAIFKAIPLHPQGSIWVNIGDKRDDGGLLGIPGKFCSAMLANGFRFIDDVVWAKSVAMVDGTTIGRVRIEPALGRLNNSGYEMFFRFTKGENNWSDTFAVQATRYNVEPQRYLPEDLMRTVTALNGRSLSNVWLVSRPNIQEKHYGCFPPELIERPVAMTCPPFVNPDGSLPRRLVDMVEYDDGIGRRTFGRVDPDSPILGRHDTGVPYIPRMPVHRRWEEIAADATPGIVLDPFAGTGTTGEVALKMGRSFIGIELYPEYVEIAQKRCAAARDHVLQKHGYDRVYEMILKGEGGSAGGEGEEREKLIFFKSFLLYQAISGWALEDDIISEGVG